VKILKQKAVLKDKEDEKMEITAVIIYSSED